MAGKIKKWTVRGLAFTGLVGMTILLNKGIEIVDFWCYDKVMEATKDW